MCTVGTNAPLKNSKKVAIENIVGIPLMWVVSFVVVVLEFGGGI